MVGKGAMWNFVLKYQDFLYCGKGERTDGEFLPLAENVVILLQLEKSPPVDSLYQKFIPLTPH